ncbi:hypothetical protein QR680_004858 [Steinernema hermaphroditum]|uniref:Cystatin domain-containing protein n=1 Tax=Steinernema hermaphroditum TaxID=289476 RepID=A0AA39LUD1_9BILA|nr:hypothetical protein QR680_004858 [Steinernema hermaphroditum]
MKTLCPLLCLLLTVASAQLPGGWVDADPYSKVIQDIAWKSVEVVNERHQNENFYLVPMEVREAKYQIVAGVRYKLTVAYGYSDCSKQNMRPVDVGKANCPPGNCLTRVTHKILAWLKPWQNFTQITVLE